MNLRTVEAASAEPLTLAEARLQCHVDAYASDGNVPPTLTHPDDSLIQSLIAAAREHVENFCNVIMTDAVYEFRAPAFGGMLLLPRGPVSDIAWVKYLDENETLQTLDPSVYYFDDNPWAPVIGAKNGQLWPTTYQRADAVRVQFSGGFNETPFPMPVQLLQAMKMMIGHWYRNRAAVEQVEQFEVPLGAQVMMMPHRRGMGV